MSRTVGTPTKAFGHSDTWETSKQYAINLFDKFTFHDDVVNFEEFRGDLEKIVYVRKWLKTKYEDIDSDIFLTHVSGNIFHHT